MAQRPPTFYLHTTVHRFESMVELTGMNSYNDLVIAVTKILGIPETHNFRESYTLEVIDFSESGPNSTNRRRTIVSDANFDKMKDKTKIHVIERVSKEEACVPVDYELPSEYIGIHLKHASFNTPPKFPNIYVSFVMKKKPFRQSVSSIKVNNNLPVWNENFLLPLLLDHDAVEKDRLSDAIIVKVVSTTEDKPDLSGAPSSSREQPSKSKDKASEDVKEAILTKFEVQLLHLKKGEPMVFKIDFKTGFVIVDMLWFEDNRSIDLSAVYQDQGKNKGHVSQAVTGGAFFFLPPPKDSYGKTGKRQEIQWFCDLPGMNSVDSLKKGDILLGKFFLSNPIIEIQENIQATKGSKYSCHVAIACEDGAYCIAESSLNRRCVSISPFFPEADFLVYRAVDQVYAKEAADWAFDIATNYDIKYSIENLRAAMTEKKEDGPSHAHQLVSRLKFDLTSHQGGNLNASRKKVPQTMMEGQFVVMAYQSKSTPYIKVSSLYISPMEFEDYLNQNPELFYFVGKITEGQCKQYNDEHNLKNTYDCNVLSTRAQEVASHLNFERKKEFV